MNAKRNAKIVASSGMYKTSRSPRKIGYVSGGAICETIDKAATEHHGFATVGAGLIIGGGYGYLSPSHGIALDNVLEVGHHCPRLAVKASKIEPELFWGIRGGGSNSGVVSGLGFQLYDQRRTVFVTSQSTTVTAEWWDDPGDKSSQIQTAVVGPNGKPVVAAPTFCDGSEAEGRAFYKMFVGIDPI
ncbi:uncharacterized protein B0H18DRAFT_1107915 [Fomitopsis serialis]|uniref:uncharacterized protein n=1 Tax=Fomitopsis serialis TaxID=139415 RepID=UPI002007C0ED|nr:uncharacterized protein B0H18DRAFT_1107915 [Neoantrodia serialis]KAH9915653.1 hypothetical protein B0H18DRAFT_1107915 [Neoantrodia serialis]